MYSPAAIEKAPASRPAIPASRMKCSTGPRRPRRPSPATGCDTRPSLDAEDDRPQRPGSGAPVPALGAGDRSGARARPASTDGWSDAVTTPTAAACRSSRARPLPLVSPSRRRQISACSRSSAAIASMSGLSPCASYSVLLVALERLDEVRDRLRPEHARGQDDQPHPGARPAGRRARSRPCRAGGSPRCPRDGARWSRCAGRPPPVADPSRSSRGASYRTIASCSSLRFSRLWATSDADGVTLNRSDPRAGWARRLRGMMRPMP